METTQQKKHVLKNTCDFVWEKLHDSVKIGI